MKNLFKRKFVLSFAICSPLFLFSCNKDGNSVETPIEVQDVIRNPADVLWEGKPSDGIKVFRNVEFLSLTEDKSYSGVSSSPNGSFFRAETDPLGIEGEVWHINKVPDDGRVEARGAKTGSKVFKVEIGKTYYIGFRFRLTAIPTSGGGNYHTIFQWKAYGEPMLQNIPLDLAHRGGGKIQYGYRDLNENGKPLFITHVVPDKWYSVVMKITVGNTETTGSTEIFWDGSSTPAQLETGGTTFTGKTFDGNLIDPKWGYYNRNRNDGHIYFSQLRIGKTFESVNPSKPI